MSLITPAALLDALPATDPWADPPAPDPDPSLCGFDQPVAKQVKARKVPEGARFRGSIPDPVKRGMESLEREMRRVFDQPPIEEVTKEERGLLISLTGQEARRIREIIVQPVYGARVTDP